MTDNLWDNLNMWLYGLVAALIGGVTILVRKIFTAEKKVALLELQLSNIKDDVHEMKTDIKSLIRRNVRVDE